MKRPAPDRPADGLQRLSTGGRQEAMRVDAPQPNRLSRPEGKSEEVERAVGYLTPEQAELQAA